MNRESRIPAPGNVRDSLKRKASIEDRVVKKPPKSTFETKVFFTEQ